MTPAPDFRIAYRIEGDYWNAYLANPADMRGATLLASISLALVPVGSSEKAKFREIVEAGLSRSLGGIEFDDPKPAPLSERAGHA
ncbi:MAG: hypothetical protein IT514_14845 [Burkholderiales bacterium]|jgi:hypothetical protein|nr:hypothetical protein [Burkholderiales bacterium]